MLAKTGWPDPTVNVFYKRMSEYVYHNMRCRRDFVCVCAAKFPMKNNFKRKLRKNVSKPFRILVDFGGFKNLIS